MLRFSKEISLIAICNFLIINPCKIWDLHDIRRFFQLDHCDSILRFFHYSWRVGKEGRIGQVDMYLNDIIDQPDGSNYFLGHYLFEKTQGNRYELIDGQQRLTTTVIFMSCLVKELRKREIVRFEYNNILKFRI